MENMRPPQKSVLLKVVILGDGGVGKSCLMNRFVSNRYDENNFHTIGVEFMNKDIVVDGEKYTLQIWDTAGQERFWALRTPFYRGSDICLLCYALNDRESLRHLKRWRDEFLQFADVKPEKFPFIVVGNKNDLRHEINPAEVQQWCTDQNIAIHIDTSSKAATNVTDAFVLAVQRWKHLERVAEAELRQDGETIDLTRPVRLLQKRVCCTGGGGGDGGTNGADYDDNDAHFADSAMRAPTFKTRQLFGQQRKATKAPKTNYQL
ncbi:ras-related protein Rab-9A [Scaptodrosophila lebanonensis]|uniref:small monomeric GTPase n=1 Tax=Drosophila lebanonensis TaxID=7225 RepID=A0A6J2TNU4_DROLE|nr:ras-related protein Rab-9A [Scaptodrosophila lebanonensis]